MSLHLKTPGFNHEHDDWTGVNFFLSKDGSFEVIIGNPMPPLGVNYYPLDVDIMIRDIDNHRFNKASSGHVNYENLIRLLRDSKSSSIDNLTEYDEEYVDKT